MSWKDFWDVKDFVEAQIKVVGEPQENPGITRENVQILTSNESLFGKALEVGAGYGRLMRAMSSYFDEIYGVDISESLIRRSGGLPIVRTDGETIPFADNTFDFVYSTICFQHMPTLKIVQSNIKEIYRVLKHGGRCRIQAVQNKPIDRDDSPTGSGRDFPSGESFLAEFEAVGLHGSVKVGEGHFQWIWVTAEK